MRDVKAAAERFRAGLIPTARHGTENAYSNYRCRCDECRAFWSLKMRERRPHLAGIPIGRRRSADERFWEKVEKIPFDSCWRWTSELDHKGYGKFWDGSRKVMAHRWAYERVIGPIPEDLTIDHLCRVRDCVNPSHLEPVTGRENTGRGIGPSARAIRENICIQGHDYTPENTLWKTKRGGTTLFRECRACRGRRRSRASGLPGSARGPRAPQATRTVEEMRAYWRQQKQRRYWADPEAARAKERARVRYRPKLPAALAPDRTRDGSNISNERRDAPSI